MPEEIPTDIGHFDDELHAPKDFEPRVQRLNPLFDFLHATLDRIQDIAEFLLACLSGIIRTWIFQFTSGLVAGLLFISFVIWAVQAIIEFFYGQ